MADAAVAAAARPLGTRLLSGSAWALLAKATLALGALASNALVARLLPPEQVGAYFLLTSIVAVASLAAQFGLQKACVRLIAAATGSGAPAAARGVVGDTFVLGLAFALPVAGLVGAAGVPLAAGVFASPAMATVSAVAGLWILARAAQSLICECFRGLQDLRLASVFGGIVQVAVAVGGLAALFLVPGGATLAGVVHVTVASFMLGAGLGALVLWRRVRTLPRPQRSAMRHLAGVAAPLGLTTLIMFSLTQADVWIVGALLGPEPVAIYGAAAKLVQLVAVPLIIVNSVVPPVISEMHVQGRARELEHVLRRVATLGGLPALAAIAVLVLAGSQVLGTVFGEWYARGADVLVVLAAGQAFNVWAGSCGSVLAMTGHQRLLLRITAVTGAVALPLAWLACRHAGVLGIALVMALTTVAQNVVMLLAVRRHLGIWTFASPGALRGARP